jgi:hypothetical protein
VARWAIKGMLTKFLWKNLLRESLTHLGELGYED